MRTVGLLGGGVIGGGWAARFLLNGVDVRLYDPDPEAPRKIGEVIANAHRAYSRLTYAPLPPAGEIEFVATPEEAAEDVDFIQESAPERLELKRDLLVAASRAAKLDVVIASSTSGLLPSRLQEGMRAPERLTVGHPFNPVYLVPLVELCGGAATSPRTTERAAEIYRSLGMHPLVVRREIDGFIADRLLEALWREALWLVNDDVGSWNASAAVDAIKALCEDRVTEVPVYDIAASARTGSHTLNLAGDQFIAEGLFAPAIVGACRSAGMLDAAICLRRNRMITFGLRLARDLREGRKSPLVLVRRGWRLMKDEPRIVADAIAHGCEPMTPKQARKLLGS
jgi:hypothetical protein